jgi:hypothetical protein
MQFNPTITMEAPFHVNPLIRLWHILDVSHILWHSFLEFFKLAKITVIQVLGLVEDECTFSILSFLNSELRNYFNEHLSIVVRMYLVGAYFIHICSMLTNKKIQIVFSKVLTTYATCGFICFNFFVYCIHTFLYIIVTIF